MVAGRTKVGEPQDLLMTMTGIRIKKQYFAMKLHFVIKIRCLLVLWLLLRVNKQ